VSSSVALAPGVRCQVSLSMEFPIVAIDEAFMDCRPLALKQVRVSAVTVPLPSSPGSEQQN
jgi:hypothetical protein